MEINIQELKKQTECGFCNQDNYPTTAWCPIGCGLALVQIEENLYYCARCKKEFVIVLEDES